MESSRGSVEHVREDVLRILVLELARSRAVVLGGSRTAASGGSRRVERRVAPLRAEASETLGRKHGGQQREVRERRSKAVEGFKGRRGIDGAAMRQCAPPVEGERGTWKWRWFDLISIDLLARSR